MRSARRFDIGDARSRSPNEAWLIIASMMRLCIDNAILESLIPSAAWSSGMILASGARGPGFNSQSSPFVIHHWHHWFRTALSMSGCHRIHLGSSPCGKVLLVDGRSVVMQNQRAGVIPKSLASQATASGVWRNGSTSDSRSEGWEFEILCLHFLRTCVGPCARAFFFSSSTCVRRQMVALGIKPGTLRATRGNHTASSNSRHHEHLYLET